MSQIPLKFQVLLLMTTCFKITKCQSTPCPAGWFGPLCQYKCHCVGNACNTTGHCQRNVRCQKGWFEHLCQYQNLLTLPSTTVIANPRESSLSWLTDDSDSTCNNDNRSLAITIQFPSPQRFTWLQVTIKERGSVAKIVLQFQTRETTPKLDCHEKDYFPLSSRRYEIRCSIAEPITRLLLTGPDLFQMCTLDINGGRNVALKQETSQYGMYKDTFPTSSDRAVDGNTSPVLSHGSCAHGSGPTFPPPTWTVKFQHEFCITRFLLYNRDEFGYRLINFSLDALDTRNASVFAYRDPRTNTLPVYDVLNVNWTKPIILVIITQSLHSHHSLTVCEVETYGECPPQTTHLFCENCHDRCILGSCFRNGSCKAGCKGYMNPPFCTMLCKQGQWGPGCNNTCDHCIIRLCNSTTGYCFGDCDGFSNPPMCTEPCREGYWGTNCANPCHNCINGSCNVQSGWCDEGCNGFTNPPKCDKECLKGQWGPHCSLNCKHCVNKSCDGTMFRGCKHGCNGYTNPPKCDEECKNHTWGPHCSQPCSKHCNRRECQTETGTCLYGCLSGYGRHDCLIAVEGFNVESTSYFIPLFFIILLIALVVALVAFLGIKSNQEEEKVIGIKEPPMTINEINHFMDTHDFNYFIQVFETIPEVEIVYETCGLLEDNKVKNTHPDIFAFDHNRVLLRTEDPDVTDYINASFIKGYKTDYKFIATQGPTKDMINDFFRMLWDQQVDVIAMLTRLNENNQVMSKDYWSDGQFGDIHVKLLYEGIFTDYTIRHLEISKEDLEPHRTTQYQYTAWPETGEPEFPWSFVDFQQMACVHFTERPIVVHCRCGSDRTGLFIALNNVLEEAEATGRVDFYNTVVNLRRDRISMIGSAEMYWFLHKAVQIGVICIGKTLTAKNISEKIESFDDLQVKEEYTAVCLMAEEFQVKEVKRPRTSIKNDVTSVILQGFKKENQRILASLPKEDQVFLFWSLVEQYKVTLIVCLDYPSVEEDVSILYLPTSDKEYLVCETFRITSTQVTQIEIWEKTLLTAQLSNNTNHSITNLKANIPIVEPEQMFAFIQQARAIDVPLDKTILYTCRNGSYMSGLVFVLCELLDKLEIGGCVTLPLVVGCLKSIRPEAIPTVEQYKTLYQVLQIAFKKGEIY